MRLGLQITAALISPVAPGVHTLSDSFEHTLVEICCGYPRIVQGLGWTIDLGFNGILTGILWD